ncbi:hypothetical protein FRUB_05626 [Fimbriiglobus ruber]|uniref:Uncharacterized protein n=1 Tax=Fimbriiglobus ruber TaxID=1908690 RepID=A0A225DQB6_9BACT|nr:hypothetical protein FRUB_05626 [Fimbriiglobus ruber]
MPAVIVNATAIQKAHRPKRIVVSGSVVPGRGRKSGTIEIVRGCGARKSQARREVPV